MQVKDSHTRIKPLALTCDHGRYITATPERTLASVGEWPLNIYSRYEFVTVSLLKRLHNGGFISETATWIQRWFKIISAGVGNSRNLYVQQFLKVETMGVVIEICIKHPRGPLERRGLIQF
jgi:hypothetical protein